MRLGTFLGNLPDLGNAKRAMVHLLKSRGQIALVSTKYYPEVAGVRMVKGEVSAEIDNVLMNPHNNIVRFICPRAVLVTEHVRRFARCAQDNYESYRVL